MKHYKGEHIPLGVRISERIGTVDTGQDTRDKLFTHLVVLGLSLGRVFLALGSLVVGLSMLALGCLLGLVLRLGLQKNKEKPEVDVE
jgi:hypothetical protein